MPWQECSKVDERLRFVARLLEGEKMAVLCREFDISRKTGHKIFNRYRECGLEGLTDRSRRPYRQANRLPFQIEALILQLKKEHPTWGAPKIREKIVSDRITALCRCEYIADDMSPFSSRRCAADDTGPVERDVAGAMAGVAQFRPDDERVCATGGL